MRDTVICLFIDYDMMMKSCTSLLRRKSKYLVNDLKIVEHGDRYHETSSEEIRLDRLIYIA